jgi:RND family efflux transporter MFP subunit
LIDAGANTPGKELFHLAATGQLRVFVNVPEIYGHAAQAGRHAGLTLAEFPGRTFTGTIARNANSIDTTSRTLLVEVDIDNKSGELLPGAYVSVHVKVEGPARRALTIPVNTMLFRQEGLRVGVVRDGKAQLVPVTIGRDYGNEVEVVAGLHPQDQVILDPIDSLTSGEAVRVSGAGL